MLRPMTRPQFFPGDPAPAFTAASTSSERFVFNSAAGRYLVLCFFGSAGSDAGAAAVAEARAARALFNDDKVAFFGVSNDPADKAEARVAAELPGLRYFWDFDGAVAKLYGAAGDDGDVDQPMWIVLDPMMRVVGRFPLAGGAAALDFIAALPAVAGHAGVDVHAPVLILPRVFERDFCARLIDYYNAGQAIDSGFMRDVDGKTRLIVDHSFKRRADRTIEDEDLRGAARARILRRLVPAIRDVFQFQVTRMERYLVACYDAGTGGYFRPHRDNTTKGTAHRRFAVTMNLNAEDYEGGDLRFPEFGPRTYRAPTGGAVVFSCSLLHEATAVRTGRRYAFLPFLYDEEGAEIRERNNIHLGEEVGAYKRQGPDPEEETADA